MANVSEVTVILMLCLCVLSIGTETATAAAIDCMDACSTGCVQRDTRLMQRCEGKCRIKCGPDGKVESVID